MSKTNGLIIAIVAVIILGGGAYAAMNYNKSVMMKEESSNDNMMKADETKTDSTMTDEAAKTDSMMKAETKTDADGMMKTEVMMDKGEGSTDTMMKAGSYEAYSPDKLAKAASGKVVLFFRASWCPSCRNVDADIKANLSKIPEQVSILDVDYDNSAELKKKYGVRSQHTFVQVEQNGTMIKTWMGSPSLSALVAEIK